MAEGVHRRRCAAMRRPVSRLMRSAATALRDRVEAGAERLRIDAERLERAIDEMRARAAIGDRVRGRDERQRRRHHLVAGFDAGQREAGMQRRGAVDDGDGALGAGDFVQHALEAVDELADRGHEGALDAFLEIGAFRCRRRPARAAPACRWAFPRRAERQQRSSAHRSDRISLPQCPHPASYIVDVSLVAREVGRVHEPCAVFSSPRRMPSSPPNSGDHPSCWRALELSAQSRSTSLLAGRSRASSVSISSSACITSAIMRAVSPIEISKPLPRLIVCADALFRRRRQARDETAHGIGHEGEVARRADRAEADRALARSDLADDGRDHGARRLPRPVGVERPDHDHRHVEGGMKRQRHLVGSDLRCRVGRLS